MRRGRNDPTSSDFTLTVINNSGATIAPAVRNCICDGCKKKITKNTDAVVWLKRSKTICDKCAVLYLKRGGLLTHAEGKSNLGHSDEAVLKLMKSGSLGRLAVVTYSYSFLITPDTCKWGNKGGITFHESQLAIFRLLIKSVVLNGSGIQNELIRLLSRRVLVDMLNSYPILVINLYQMLEDKEREVQLGVLKVLPSLTWGRTEKLNVLEVLGTPESSTVSEALQVLLNKMGIKSADEMKRAMECQSYVDSLMKTFKPDVIRQMHQFVFRFIPGSESGKKCSQQAYKIVSATLNEPDIERLFFALPQKTQKLISFLLWNRSVLEHTKLDAELNIQSTCKIRNTKGWRDDYYIDVSPEYRGLLGIMEIDRTRSGIVLNHWFSERFKLVVPKPDDTSLIGEERPPDIACAELIEYNPDFVALLPGLFRTVNQNMLTLKNNGLPSASAYRKMISFGGSYKEFYPDHRSLRFLRSELLYRMLKGINIPSGIDITPRVVVKAVLAFLFEHKYEHKNKYYGHGYANKNLIPRLMPYLEWHTYEISEEFVKRYLTSIKILMENLPRNRWVSVDKALDYLFYHDLNLCPLDASYIAHAVVEDSWGSKSYGRITRASASYYWDEPLLKTFLLLFASVGAVDIFCGEAKCSGIPAYRKEYLSRADGVVAFRLSPLGEWHFQDGDDSCFKKIDPGKVVLDSKRLLLYLQGNDITLKTTLEQTATPVGGGFYSVESGSFLQECTTEEAVIQKINAFKALLPEKIPEVWQDFFENTLARLNPLQHVKANYTILELKDTPELKRHLLSNEKLRKLVTLAEGGLILVPKKNIKALKRILADLGFYVDIF